MFIIFYTGLIIFYAGLIGAYFVYCFQYDWKQTNILTIGILSLLGIIMWFWVVFA
jgi:hypothetical protein|nr:MAG TPA: protein of unknown function (UPF0242) [Bacteriophage sp.]